MDKSKTLTLRIHLNHEDSCYGCACIIFDRADDVYWCRPFHMDRKMYTRPIKCKRAFMNGEYDYEL